MEVQGVSGRPGLSDGGLVARGYTEWHSVWEMITDPWRKHALFCFKFESLY